MYLVAELAAEQRRDKRELAERMRYSRQVLTLRRARRIEHRAERRLLEAWRRAAELRGSLNSADC